MKDEGENDKRDPESKNGKAGVAGEEATGQIPTTPVGDRSARKAREESGESPARGVAEKKGDTRE